MPSYILPPRRAEPKRASSCGTCCRLGAIALVVLLALAAALVPLSSEDRALTESMPAVLEAVQVAALANSSRSTVRLVAGVTEVRKVANAVAPDGAYIAELSFQPYPAGVTLKNLVAHCRGILDAHPNAVGFGISKQWGVQIYDAKSFPLATDVVGWTSYVATFRTTTPVQTALPGVAMSRGAAQPPGSCASSSACRFIARLSSGVPNGKKSPSLSQLKHAPASELITKGMEMLAANKDASAFVVWGSDSTATPDAFAMYAFVGAKALAVRTVALASADVSQYVAVVRAPANDDAAAKAWTLQVMDSPSVQPQIELAHVQGWVAGGAAISVIATRTTAAPGLAIALLWGSTHIDGDVASVDVEIRVTVLRARDAHDSPGPYAGPILELTGKVDSPLFSSCEVFLAWRDAEQRYSGKCTVVVGRAETATSALVPPAAGWAGAGRPSPVEGTTPGSPLRRSTAEVDFRNAGAWTLTKNPGGAKLRKRTLAWGGSLSIADLWAQVAVGARPPKPCGPFAGRVRHWWSGVWDGDGALQRAGCALPIAGRTRSDLETLFLGKTVMLMGDSQLRTTYEAMLRRYCGCAGTTDCPQNVFPYIEYCANGHCNSHHMGEGKGNNVQNGGCGVMDVDGTGVPDAANLSTFPKSGKEYKHCNSQTARITPICRGSTFTRYGEGNWQGAVEVERVRKGVATRFVYMVSTTLHDRRFTEWEFAERWKGSVDVVFFGNGLHDANFNVDARWGVGLEAKVRCRPCCVRTTDAKSHPVHSPPHSPLSAYQLAAILPLMKKGGSIQYVGPHASLGTKRGHNGKHAYAASFAKQHAVVTKSEEICATFGATVAAQKGVVVQPSMDWWGMSLRQRAKTPDGVHLLYPNPQVSTANVFLHNAAAFIHNASAT